MVVGGGISGIGLYHELAHRGVKVLLVEQEDFCSGASAALSRMVHGGLRYMENGEFKLVRESLKERNRLLRNAPHYVAPLKTTIPIMDVWSGLLNAGLKFIGASRRTRRRGAVLIKVGLTLYDVFTRRDRALPTHYLTGSAKTRRSWPDFNDKIICSATYYDAWISHPERIGIELLRDTDALEVETLALNYAQVSGMQGNRVLIKDKVSGQQVSVRAKLIVNATGAWLDFTNAILSREAGEAKTPMTSATKGSHLIINNANLRRALRGGMIYFENHDGRVCIMFPYFGNVLLGSTDLKVETPEQAVCSDAERAYILDSLSGVFPKIKVSPEQIIYTFSGVRPLVQSNAHTTGQISRDHYTHLIEPSDGFASPILCMIGGKWTTYRAFGEQTAQRVMSLLGRTRSVSTKNMAIGGGRNYPTDPGGWINRVSEQSGVPLARVSVLFQRYGTLAREVVDFISIHPDAPLPGAPDYSKREIRFLVDREYVVHPIDVLKRRTSIAISGRLSGDVIAAVVEVMGDAFGWSKNQRFRRLIETKDHFMKFNAVSACALDATHERRESTCISPKKSA